MLSTLTAGLAIQRLSSADVDTLARFFTVLAADPETTRFFHPHPFTRAMAARLCTRPKVCRDRYYLMRYRERIVAYSMLRGWDEGYAIPSFGGCTHPALRGAGLGQALLAHAIEDSRRAGAARLRLTVYRENERALHVYRKFGFVFPDKGEPELTGLLDLATVGPLPVRPPDYERLDAWSVGTINDER